MHEKLVFIDDEVLWHGSLNPLSFSDTQILERRHSKAVVEDYQRTLRLEELLGAYEQREAERGRLPVLRRRDRCSRGATTLLLALRRGQLLLTQHRRSDAERRYGCVH